MPNDTVNDLDTTAASGLLDKVGTMLNDAVETVQDMVADLSNDADATDISTDIADAETMDADDMNQDDMDDEDDTGETSDEEVV